MSTSINLKKNEVASVSMFDESLLGFPHGSPMSTQKKKLKFHHSKRIFHKDASIYQSKESSKVLNEDLQESSTDMLKFQISELQDSINIQQFPQIGQTKLSHQNRKSNMLNEIGKINQTPDIQKVISPYFKDMLATSYDLKFNILSPKDRQQN